MKIILLKRAGEGQTPCLLRNAHALLRNQDNESYSEHEKSERFNKCIEHTYKNSEVDLKGRNLPYCFKDMENKYNKEKNQVHTRALYAEENAFLQIAKYGGTGVKGGYLFVTAVPCVLCSKKSYHLGIKEIYYIDPYPDIAETHILKTGDTKMRTKLVLFYGATGGAYAKLFDPIMSYKDELDALIDFKYLDNDMDVIGKEIKDNGWSQDKTDRTGIDIGKIQSYLDNKVSFSNEEVNKIKNEFK